MTDNHITETVDIIKKLAPNFIPKVGIILGSGLGPLADLLEDSHQIEYSQLPAFPQLSVQGHTGILSLGYLNGVPVACLQGRSHLYEGYSHLNPDKHINTLMAPIRVLKLLGADTLFNTNAVGSLHAENKPGSLVVITDHINALGTSPLIGTNDDRFGPRFPGMENAYDPMLRELVLKAAQSSGITITEGVYIATLGPQFETPAEILAFRILGADVVGMSTVPEVITARHCGLRVVAVSAITNLAAGLHQGVLSHDVTLAGAKVAVQSLQKLVLSFLQNYAELID